MCFELSFLSIRQKTITRNSEFSLPSMIPCVTNFRVIVFYVGPKTITRNSPENESEISEFSENSELSLWPKSLGGIGFTLSYPGFLIHAGAIFCNFVAMATAQNLTNWLNFVTQRCIFRVRKFQLETLRCFRIL